MRLARPWDRCGTDRFSASILPRSRRWVWIASLLALVCAGLGYLQWQHFALGRGAGETAGEAGSVSRFLSVQGGVEYRRGDLGAWRQAQSGLRLTWGDWIKSSDDGRAEIRFPDGSTYVAKGCSIGGSPPSAGTACRAHGEIRTFRVTDPGNGINRS